MLRFDFSTFDEKLFCSLYLDCRVLFEQIVFHFTLVAVSCSTFVEEASFVTFVRLFASRRQKSSRRMGQTRTTIYRLQTTPALPYSTCLKLSAPTTARPMR
jgi:hypothetical protein